MFIGIIITLVVTSSLNSAKLDVDVVEALIVDVFCVQAIISIGAFVSPKILEIVHHFQFAHDAEKAETSYNGFRGLAVSGRLYFEFAASCGLVTIIQFKRLSLARRASFIEYVKLFLIIICGFFAGRTSLVGVGFGFLYLVFCRTNIGGKFRFLARFTIITVGLIGIVVIILPPDTLMFLTDHVLPWVFDLFIKYTESGSTEGSHSFNTLNEMYEYVTITDQEWFIGSGYYMSPSGTGYYKSVDAGYLRQLLYWGVVGSAVSYLFTLLFFIKPYKLTKSINEKLFIFIILIYTYFTHYKGDLASTSRFYLDIILFLLLPYVVKNRKVTV
ncbi:MAG: hypothetical protein K2J70_03945 [Muribaculaceae bacterium]|nr:hypothetical protein [Muribaculaceae bacterium]